MAEEVIMAHATKVSAKEFSAKYKSKYEVYRFLTVDCGHYISPYNTVSIYFLRDLAAGIKRRKLLSHA